MSGRGREARPTSYFSRNDTHQTAIKRIISHCHAEYAYKKRFLEVSSFLGATEGSVIAGGRSKKGAEWLPLRPFGGDGELYAVAQHGNGERKLVFSSSRVLTTAVN